MPERFGGDVDETTKVMPKLVSYDRTINYADGSEKTLLDLVSSPQFSESTTWRGTREWALYYHLSPLRRNLLNWIDYGDKPKKILELGAGCGAITAFFVTIPGAQVTAVEGSLDRAKVIQARCKDRTNLEIHACNLNEFKPDGYYDIVSLIGVLEYSGRYESGNDPFLAVLTRAASLLNDDGYLVLAIENLLGHKYLAGSPEDHYGQAYEGVNGYPHYSGVKTFNKHELTQKLQAAGFVSMEWYYPYPDYKLPSVVFCDRALTKSQFDWLALTDVPPEQNSNRQPAFNELSFLDHVRQSLGATGAGAFMNSFLVIASKKNLDNFNKCNGSLLAYKSNIKFRAGRYQTTTSFIEKNEDSIVVVRKKIGTDPISDSDDLTHCIEQPIEAYHASYRNMYNEILTAVFSNDYQQAAALFTQWTRLLDESSMSATPEDLYRFSQFCAKHFDRPLYKSSSLDKWIDGRYLDLIPVNVLISPDSDNVALIDLEWQIKFKIPTQLVFDRGLHVIGSKIYNAVRLMNISVNGQTQLPDKLYMLLKQNPFFKQIDATSRPLFETWFQVGITNGDFNRPLDWNALLPRIDMSSDGPGFDPTRQLGPSEKEILENTVKLVEAGKNTEALAYYDKHRNKNSKSSTLRHFDSLMEQIREKIAQ